MRKSLLTVIAAASIAAMAIAMPSKAEARCWGCWAGGAFAVGLIGGAIIANSAYGYGYPGYGYGYGYGYAPYYGGYYAPAYYGYAPSYYYAPRYYGYGYGYGYRPYRAYY